MPTEATWFGPADRPLAGWLHVPDDGRARGGVVISPPLGQEYVNSRRTLRTLAEQLTELGLVALRFDYDGTGDSAGTADDPARLARWLASVTAADAEIRAVVGDAPVAHVGLRIGATFTLALLRDGALPPCDALVGWDACPSGRRFLREQTALGRLVGCAEQPDGTLDTPGTHYSPETAADLAAVNVTSLPSVSAAHVLVLSRPNSRRLLAEQDPIVREEAAGMLELLEVDPVDVVVPTPVVDRCARWLDETLPRPRTDVRAHWEAAATVADGVVERTLRLGKLGLAAVETVPADRPATGRPVLFLTTGVECHVGPVRLWTELGRQWAAAGVRSVRADLSGLGDSPTRPGCRSDLLYAPYDMEDAQELLEAVGADAVVVGFCSGAHLAFRAASGRPGVSLVAVNTPTTLPLGPLPIPRSEAAGLGVSLRRTLDAAGVRSRIQRLLRWWRGWAVRLPAGLWLALGALRLIPSPGRHLPRGPGTDVTLVCGPEDAYSFQTRGRWDLRRAVRGGLEFVVDEHLDHMPMPLRQRRALAGRLTAQVARRVGVDLAAVALRSAQ